MKTILRNTTVYGFALFLLPLIIPSIKITGGFSTYFVSGLMLSFLFLFIKPLLTILSFPLNLITLGLFSAFINVIILYLLTVLIQSISISSFVFDGVSFMGFVIPRMVVNTFFVYVIAAILIAIVVSFVHWLFQ